MERNTEERTIAVIAYRRRSRPAYHYQSDALKYYVPYLAYYRCAPTRENLENIVKQFKMILQEKGRKGDELVMFPVRGVDAIVNYAKSLNAEIQYFPQRLARIGRDEQIPVIVFPDRYSSMRHFIFSITYATVRSVSKAEKVREVVNGISVNILEPFYYVALYRYYELKSNSDSQWRWKLLRIGRAFKVMYLIDKG